MTRQESGRLGAMATMRIIRNRYHSNPNYCQWCNGPISLKDTEPPSEARRRKFCSRTCAATWRNQGRTCNRKNRTCKKCSALFWSRYTSRKWCDDCQINHQQYLLTRTKSDVSRAGIAKHARESVNIVKCQWCGYDTFIDVSHIKAVKDFPEDALLSEINHPSNLLCLCLNHHHEYDAGLISLEEILSLCTGHGN